MSERRRTRERRGLGLRRKQQHPFCEECVNVERGKTVGALLPMGRRSGTGHSENTSLTAELLVLWSKL